MRWVALAALAAACGGGSPVVVPPPRAPSSPIDRGEACDAGGAPSCFDAALIAERRGEAIARTLFARACDAGDGRACRQMHFRDRCETGDDDGCADLALLYFDAPERSLDAHAIDLLGAACGRGGAKACGALGRELDEGQRVPRDLMRSIPLLEKGCDVVAQHCRRLWRIYTHGEVPRDPVKAKSAADRACALDATHCP